MVPAALLLGACAFHDGSLGGSSGDDSPDNGMPDQDSDQDGFADAVDNCPMVGNADQRDHDGDARGDACDACPHLIDTAADTDHDGVGDACDPHPATAGDRIAYFEGFYEPVSWKSVIGANTWQTVDGTLRQSHLDTSYQLVRDDTPDPHDVFVDARIRINALSSSTTERRSTGVVFGYEDRDHYLFCVLVAQGTGADVNVGEQYTDWFGTPQFDFNPAVFDPQMSSDWITLQARTRQVGTSTEITCTTKRGTSAANVSFTADRQPAGDIGVRTNGADTSFDYVFVVEVPAGSS